MQSFQLSSHINQHGVLQIQLPESLANQEIDLILVIQQKNPQSTVINYPIETIKIPNAVTYAALKQADSGILPHFETVKELFDDLEKDSEE
jgi:hypothetical protein